MMLSNSDKKSSNKRQSSNINERAEVRYFKGEEQFERWRKEFIQNQDQELKLASISKLSYEPIEYQSLLVREEFAELKLTDYSYLIDKFTTKAEATYFYPIAVRITAIVFLFGILVILFSPITLLITAALGVAAAVSLYFTSRDREEAIKKAEQAARDEIERCNEQERLAYKESKHLHDEKENSRIVLAEQLITGEPSAVLARMDEALGRLKLPVVVEVDIDFYENILLVKVWLPSKAVIPKQICEMLPSGRLQYQDKDTLVFNKQYFELCSAVILQIMSTILANVPSFQEAYATGIVKNDLSDDCVLAVKIPREQIANISRATSAVAAMQRLEAVYECDTSLALYPVEMLYPSEWEEIDKQLLKSLKVRIFK